MAVHKKKLYGKIAEFLVGEMITSGFSLVLIVYGVNYFSLKFAWKQIVVFLANQSGVVGKSLLTELTVIGDKIFSSFPFNIILSGEGFGNLIILGLIIAIIGIAIKIAMTPTKQEFYSDFASNFYVPGIVGIIATIVLQVVMIISLNQVARKSSFTEVLKALNTVEFSSGVSMFGAYSDLFMAGIYLICIGSVIYSVLKVRQIKNPFLRIFAKVMVNSGFVFMIYYIFVRIISMKFISMSIFGPVLGLFAVTAQMSNTAFMISILMIITGFEIKKYSNRLKAKHDRSHIDLFHMHDHPRSYSSYHKSRNVQHHRSHVDRKRNLYGRD
jgi:uncharacterized protein YjeT (DUF2065 family)